jgi:hypothetical protein
VAADEDPASGNRLRVFLIHLAAYFATAAVLVVVNLATMPERPWFVLPVVGWGGVLTIHAAHVMGLFGGLSGGRKEPPGRGNGGSPP